MRKQIQELLNSNITAYRIHAETGISQSNIGEFRSGKRNLDNLSLKNAEKLYNLYNKLEENKMNIIEQVRKELENSVTGYYVEDYANFNELLEETDMTKVEYLERITEVNHQIVEDVPVIVYENPESSLYNVAFVSDGMTAEDVLSKLR